MSAEPLSPAALPRPPAEPLWVVAVRRGLAGLALGLVAATVFVVLDHRKADSVTAVCVQARILAIQFHAEKRAWPKDFDLAQPGDQFGGFKLAPLTAAVAKCEVPGAWAFVAARQEVVFTPAAPGRSYERVFGVVDRRMDDGDPAAGDLRVASDRAVLRLSAE
jgi:soluble lytic murein transglycosylase-like protein